MVSKNGFDFLLLRYRRRKYFNFLNKEMIIEIEEGIFLKLNFYFKSKYWI